MKGTPQNEGDKQRPGRPTKGHPQALLITIFHGKGKTADL
jgi:hypothetical protein